MSARGDKSEEATRAGADGYLVKPIDLEELERELHRLVPRL